MDTPPSALVLVHRIVGYPTAFLVGPAALLAFASPRVHRRWGKAYLVMMTFLYLTGTYFTLTEHEWTSWDFARNVVFNFFGFSMVLYGWRAIYLFRQPAREKPARLDWLLAAMLAATVLGLLVVAAVRDTPMRVFCVIGVVWCWLEFRELRGGLGRKSVLFRRHLRFILASYFYVLTVVSVVHLHDELPRTVQWTWPAVLGGIVIYVVTGDANRWIAPARGRMLRWAVRGTLAITILYGGYVAYDLIRGGAVAGQDPRGSGDGMGGPSMGGETSSRDTPGGDREAAVNRE